MTKPLLLTAFIAGLIGFVLGNAFWYLASPLWIDRVVTESLPAELANNILAKGRFKDADSSHRGKGNTAIFESAAGTQILRFTEFEATNGPDLEVWLVASGEIKQSRDVINSKFVSLGPLKGNIGDQNYVLPKAVKASDYRSVVIWCKQFGVLFASARLGAP